MTIALRGSQNAASAVGVTSLTCNVPTGVVDGDLLIWIIQNNTVNTASTPAGWTLLRTQTGVSQHLGIFYRVAASEPASYTHAALTSGKWAMTILAFSGVDAATPFDVTTPAFSSGTTALSFPAITPVTAGAGIVAVGRVHGTTGVNMVPFSNGNLDTLDGQAGDTGSGVNPSHGYGSKSWSSGAFTAAMTYAGVSVRTLGAAFALRPSLGTTWSDFEADDGATSQDDAVPAISGRLNFS